VFEHANIVLQSTTQLYWEVEHKRQSFAKYVVEF